MSVVDGDRQRHCRMLTSDPLCMQSYLCSDDLSVVHFQALISDGSVQMNCQKQLDIFRPEAW